MFQSLKAIFSFDIEKELNYIVSVLKNKEEREVIAEENCKKALQLGFRFILLTHPDCQQVNYMLCIGWKLLEGVRVHNKIVKELIHPDLVKDLYVNVGSVNCNRTETIKVIHWMLNALSTVKDLTMAVKQPEIVHDNTAKADLALLAEHIQLLSEQPSYFPSTTELVLWCKNVVIFLSKVQIPRDTARHPTFYAQVQQVEDFLQRVLSDINTEMRDDVVFAILKQLYSIISRPGSEACPAVCVVLSVVQPAVISSAVGWLIRGGAEAQNSKIEEGSNLASLLDTDAGLRTALATLCRWLCIWNYTPVLCNWVLSFMKALQDAEKFDILVDISLEVINELFDALLVPAMHSSVSHIFLYIMACMRHTMEAFQKIAPRVIATMEKLASDSAPSSRPLLQNLVETLSALLDQHPMLKDTYPDIVKCLDSHIKPNQCNLMNVPVWQNSSDPEAPDRVRVGLLNLGNTCYMNSVLQALLNTKQFSNGILSNNIHLPLMSKLGSLFALMMYTVRPCINPSDFYVTAKPPNFVRDNQQDSSEFLCYLLDLLHEQERYSMMLNMNKKDSDEPSYKRIISPPTSPKPIMNINIVNNNNVNNNDNSPDLTEAVVPDIDIVSSTASCSSQIYYNPGKSSNDNPEDGGGQKRPETDNLSLNPMQKRKCSGIVGEQGTSKEILSQTIVQKAFGGILTTCVRCSECQLASTKNDVFRDLQLAFPDRHGAKNTRGSYSVQELLDFYCSPEDLSGDNRYLCQHCKCLREAERFITIKKAPKNLILVLKHFWYDPKTQIRAKLLHRVEHNKVITIMEGGLSVTYELYGAVVHSGTQLDSGHYYTFTRDSPQTWYKFNDHWVARCTEDELHKLSPPNTPYILFYKQVESKVAKDNVDKEGSTSSDTKISIPPDNEGAYEKHMNENTEEDSMSTKPDFDINEESLPFAHLPPRLIEHIRNDNVVFRSQNKRESRIARSMQKSLAGNSRRDPDDDPPSSCGGTNDLTLNCNRYIY